MSRIGRIVVALTVLTAGALFSQGKPELVAVAQLRTNPERYLGQRIAVHAVIDESNGPAGKLKLIEVEKPGSAAKAQAPFLFAALSKDSRIALPKNGQEAIVTGEIQMLDKIPIFQVVSINADKDVILRFLRSSEKRPRPGDNLGHDAQPSRSISE